VALLKTICRKSLHGLAVLWLTVTILFAALHLIRGNPIDLFLDTRLTPAKQDQLKRLYGYDRDPFTRYVHYLGALTRGEMGVSFIYKEPVSRALGARLGRSLWLGFLGYALGLAVAALLLAGAFQQRAAWLRRLCSGATTALLATPSFAVAAALIALFAARLRWAPMYGSGPLFGPTEGWRSLLALLRHSLLPALSLALPLGAYFAAYLREQLERMRDAPFVLSARGRGVSERRVFWNHQLRAALPSLIQLMGLYLPMVAGGALAVEAVFGWSGMGLLLYDAVLARDYPLLLGGALWTAAFVIAGYELADGARAALDRRMRGAS